MACFSKFAATSFHLLMMVVALSRHFPSTFSLSAFLFLLNLFLRKFIVLVSMSFCFLIASLLFSINMLNLLNSASLIKLLKRLVAEILCSSLCADDDVKKNVNKNKKI